MRRRRTAILALTSALAALGAARAADTPPPATPGWTNPFKPFRITDGLYYVGSEDLAAYLITGKGGHILLDGGVAQNVPMELANIRALGFEPKDVKVLLNSHSHLDHAGVLAGLKAATGARLDASPEDAAVIERGGKGDFAFGDSAPYPAAKVDHLLKDGEKVTVGGVTLTAHFTPGHTKGCTSWSGRFVVDGKARDALFICSVSVLPQFKMQGDPRYPNQAADYEHTFATLKSLPCELFFGEHGGFYDMIGKRAKQQAGGPNPFIDPAGCRSYLDKGEAEFRRRLVADKAKG